MRSHRTFLAILAIYLLLAVAYSVALPLGEAPDEADHYAYIVYLGEHRSLPEGTTVTQSKHPPLYHAAAAALTTWTGLDFTFLRSNPDALPLGPDKPPNFFIHTTLEDFPWTGGPLAMHLARFLSIFFGAVTVWAAWRLGTEVFPERPAIGLLAAAFLAGLPGFLFISASINNDNAAATFGALAVLLCAVTLRRGLVWWRSLLLGVCLGLGLLSKVGTLALWPVALLAVGGAWWLSTNRKQVALRAVVQLILIYGVAVLVASPWLLRNGQLYGDPLAWDLVRATVDQRLEPLRLADIGWLLRGFHTSLWGRFAAAGQVAAPTWVFTLAAVFTAIVIAGAVLYLARGKWQIDAAPPSDPSFEPTPPITDHRSPITDTRSLFWLHLTLLAAAPLLMFLSIVRYSAIALGTDQVRLMFPALSAMAVWTGVGVVGLVDWVGKGGTEGKGGKRGKEGKGGKDRVVVGGFAGGMAVFGLAVLLGVIRPGFAPPEPIVPAGSVAGETLAAFGPLELVAAELPGEPVSAGSAIPVRLWWRAGAEGLDDLRPAVRLVHSDGWLAAEWSHSPADGRHSTDHWQEGEVFEDSYLLLPNPGPPGVYTVEVGVRPFGGDWLPAREPADNSEFHIIGQVIYQ
ncbi:MAG: glycosyltransferase family 39 protein [Anaerolineae bacterium]|nr:glycosyltransferase family 39 protein [Anaerolineae bacterium]